ncbi:hypothetical protein ZIOFF_011252 [Zingiber officinale]|uniref:Uncharacterized protein n=1 Tax=Zingiber officinale TaxID=94328 RepID=A0A8J5HQT9_ZINOF|nr:hypothetical protein ZIOFF_011252 [Zingiber officinale]
MVPDLDKQSVVEAKKLKIQLPEVVGTLQFAHQKYVQKWCNKKGDTTWEIGRSHVMIILILWHFLSFITNGVEECSVLLFIVALF